ncbi:MAG: hypothetical protein R3C11_22080 [Planctomycetaceae bacterium]
MTEELREDDQRRMLFTYEVLNWQECESDIWYPQKASQKMYGEKFRDR